ncbi:L-lactate dehydrogenase A chain-like [Pogonomyrmex barbatus]|uniref:L-lactate dehydrogenase A chain-like n=1 Tax=Pogonomyrmex barbatus TaxID=144034 RepID=A0A6I9WDN7_9HYME|nr:L-lactate dehydrogenase A chain-like [Pogonomyrmex barbatus]
MSKEFFMCDINERLYKKPIYLCLTTDNFVKSLWKKKTNYCNCSSPCLREELLCKTSEPVRDCCHKVTVVGAGMVGVALANSLLFQRVTSHIAMVDVFPKKLEGEGMDFSHSSVFIGDPKIEYDTDFCVTSNSKVVAICAGVRQIKGETRLDLVQRNIEILKSIIPPLVNYSPNAVFLVVSNPVPLWSGVNVAGVQFRDIIPNIGLETDDERWIEISNDVIKLGAMVRCLKGYSNTAIGLSAADIIIAILRNTQTIIPVSTLVQGHHDVGHEMFLSLPCAIGENGITQIIRMHMTEYEKKQFQSSANSVYNVQKDISIKS